MKCVHVVPGSRLPAERDSGLPDEDPQPPCSLGVVMPDLVGATPVFGSRSKVSAAIDGAALGIAAVAMSILTLWWYAQL